MYDLLPIHSSWNIVCVEVTVVQMSHCILPMGERGGGGWGEGEISVNVGRKKFSLVGGGGFPSS